MRPTGHHGRARWAAVRVGEWASMPVIYDHILDGGVWTPAVVVHRGGQQGWSTGMVHGAVVDRPERAVRGMLGWTILSTGPALTQVRPPRHTSRRSNTLVASPRRLPNTYGGGRPLGSGIGSPERIGAWSVGRRSL